LAAAVFGLTASAALAFEETTIGGGESKAPAAQVLELPAELPQAPSGEGKGLNLTPELPLTSGTEVKIPGLGTVGVLPKLDFGLELLYGASE
jgi:hypothetical protein